MSNTTNENLIAEAYELLPELAGTGLDVVMESDIANNDLEGLWAHIVTAREMLREE